MNATPTPFTQCNFLVRILTFGFRYLAIVFNHWWVSVGDQCAIDGNDPPGISRRLSSTVTYLVQPFQQRANQHLGVLLKLRLLLALHVLHESHSNHSAIFTVFTFPTTQVRPAQAIRSATSASWL